MQKKEQKCFTFTLFFGQSLSLQILAGISELLLQAFEGQDKAFGQKTVADCALSKHKHSPPLWCYKSSSVPLVFDYRPRTPVPALLCTQNKLITYSHTVSVNNPKTMQIPSFTHSTQPLTHYPVPKMCFHGQISCWILDQLDFFNVPPMGVNHIWAPATVFALTADSVLV